MIIYIGIIVFFNIAFYWRTLSMTLISDDITVYGHKIEKPKSKWMWFWHHFRGIKYHSVWFSHFQSFAIHTLNCVMIYLVFGCNLISFLASLLFCINPVNNQGAVWISGRIYAINLFCALAAFGLPYLSVLPYLIGTYFFGPNLIFMPLVFLFTKHWYFAFLCLWGLQRELKYIFNKKDPASKINTESNSELLAIKPDKIFLAIKTFGYYITNCLFCFRLGFYHQFIFLHGVDKAENEKAYTIDRFFLIGLFAIYVFVTNLLFNFSASKVFLFGFFWFAVNVMMWCNIITFNQTIALRYIYIGNAGLMLSLASILINYPYLIVAFMVFYATRLYYFLRNFTSEFWSIEIACLEQPEFYYVWLNKGVHNFLHKNYQGALSDMLIAEYLKPNDWKLIYDICQIYLMLGNLSMSRKYYDKALTLTIDGREKEIKALMDRLDIFIKEVEEQGKTTGKVDIDVGKFDMQR